MLLIPGPEHALHRAKLVDLLTAIVDDPIGRFFGFKGGTCAAMRDCIDRFSLDLDFDLLIQDEKDLPDIRKSLEAIIIARGFTIADQSQKVPQYFLKYPAKGLRVRNSLKIDMCYPIPKSNDYEQVTIKDIDRIVTCQTLETMVANKLIAVLGRYEKRGHITSRDVYDIHGFFLHGLRYKEAIIEERTGKSLPDFFEELIAFIEKKFFQEEIDHGLNILLPPADFKRMRLTLKPETLLLLRDELKRLQSP